VSRVWSLRARAADGFTQLTLELRDTRGYTLEWIDLPPARHGEPREAMLVANAVASASRGAVTRGAALRLLREKDAA
jgi:hypothetical protein